VNLRHFKAKRALSGVNFVREVDNASRDDLGHQLVSCL
jgi:hypothetical protein